MTIEDGFDVTASTKVTAPTPTSHRRLTPSTQVDSSDTDRLVRLSQLQVRASRGHKQLHPTSNHDEKNDGSKSPQHG